MLLTHPLVDRAALAERLVPLHQSRKYNLYLAATGAGSGLQTLLWSVPGASAFLAGASFPYDARVTERFTGRAMKNAVSELTAIRLAVASFFVSQETCLRADGEAAMPIGLGLTAAVQTSRERRGKDHVHLAIRTTGGVYLVHAEMEKGRLSRVEQGEVCDLLALNMLFSVLGVDQLPIPSGLGVQSSELRETEQGLVVAPRLIAPPEAPTGVGEGLLVDEEGVVAPVCEQPKILFPGSFRPFHYGHDAIAMRVQELTGIPVTLEISRDNADKPTVSVQEVLDRTVQFRGRWPVVVTRGMPRLLDKARVFPGSGFVIGGDTADRILDPRFYGDIPNGVEGALAEFRALGTKFYVVPRSNGGEEQWSFGRIPAGLADLFISVPGRWDISSSKLRASVPDPRPPFPRS
jgi:nicotinamide mononucleotide (NMN) deamidase PncC